jgi:hypothetical protein
MPLDVLAVDVIRRYGDSAQVQPLGHPSLAIPSHLLLSIQVQAVRIYGSLAHIAQDEI